MFQFVFAVAAEKRLQSMRAKGATDNDDESCQPASCDTVPDNEPLGQRDRETKSII